MSFTVGSQAFPTKTSAMCHVKTILDTCPLGLLPPTSNAFMLALVREHHHDPERFTGVTEIGVEIAPHTTHRRFYFIRPDKERNTFSWKKCFQTETAYARVSKAARYEILPQILEVLDMEFLEEETILCPLLRIPIQRNESHVDHQFPRLFCKLLQKWMERKCLTPEQIEVEETGDEIRRTQFRNRDYAAHWQTFHRKWARLRVISAEANLQLGMKEAPE